MGRRSLKMDVMRWPVRFCLLALAGGWLGGAAVLADAAPARPNDQLAQLLGDLDMRGVTSGILYDRVVPLSRIAEFAGRDAAPPIRFAEWRQIYYELWRASLAEPAWPELRAFLASAEERRREGTIPLAVLNFRYHRIRPEAFQDGTLEMRGDRLVSTGGNPFREERLFAAAALRDYTCRGGRLRFVLDPERWLTNDGAPPAGVEIDFDDGLGWCRLPLGRPVEVHYDAPGRKIIRLREAAAEGGPLYAAFPFEVRLLQTPLPQDTLAVTATVPYQGLYGTGQAFVYLSDQHAALTNPVVVVEGFDLDNSMDWDELYQLLNQQNLLETLRTEGFDAVVLNFTEATDPIQRNAFVIAALIQQVEAVIAPSQPLVLVGASMGGLASRYALAWMEAQAIGHRVRTFISFDAPQRGADIPLGLQYWLAFFADLSEDAAYLLSRLDTPAARQMLVYHHTDPPGATGESDPSRAVLAADLAAVGDYPASPRRVAIANGSGFGANQGFGPGDQIIDYEYGSFLVDIVGNIWAVPDGGPHRIFDGLIDFILLPPTVMQVDVSGTAPYDNAPGGWRASMAQMDSTEAPYGDIVALHRNHCFIPTVSALAVETDDLFYDIAGDPDLLDHTPFDAVYFPAENQEHVSITSESATWFLDEVRAAVTEVAAAPGDAPAGLALATSRPNPFRGATTIRFELPREERVDLRVFDAAGREVATLVEGTRPAGPQEVVFRAEGLASGVYFYRLRAAGLERTGKLAVMR